MRPILFAALAIFVLTLASPSDYASAQGVGSSSGTGMCSDRSGRNFPCGGGGRVVPRGPTQTEILNTDLFNLLGRLVKETDLRWSDIPNLDWGKTLQYAAALTDRVFAGTRRRYYSEQRRRTYAEGDLRAASNAAGKASTALRDANTQLAIESRRRDVAENRRATQQKRLTSLERTLKRRQATINRVQTSIDEIRNRFYARAQKLKFLPQKPSAYRVALAPPSPVYDGGGDSSRVTGANRARIDVRARAGSSVRAVAVDPSNAFVRTKADTLAIRQRFKEIEKTARSIRAERVRADRAETATRRLTRLANTQRSRTRRAFIRKDDIRYKANRLERQLAKLRDKVKRVRGRLRKVDNGLVKSVVEWAVWQELDRRMQSAVNQLTVTRVIDLSGVNKVLDVMKAAAVLAEDIFKVLRETPQALVHDPAAIPRLERDIDAAVRKFNVSFHSTVSGLPGWLTKKISRHTSK